MPVVNHTLTKKKITLKPVSVIFMQISAHLACIEHLFGVPDKSGTERIPMFRELF